MSIGVPLEELPARVPQWGPCFFLTVSDDERPHVVALRPTVNPEGLCFEAGNGRAVRNAAARPLVTLVFAPIETSEGYSLVIDGLARIEDESVVVEPTNAVLHRPAP